MQLSWRWPQWGKLARGDEEAEVEGRRRGRFPPRCLATPPRGLRFERQPSSAPTLPSSGSSLPSCSTRTRGRGRGQHSCSRDIKLPLSTGSMGTLTWAQPGRTCCVFGRRHFPKISIRHQNENSFCMNN